MILEQWRRKEALIKQAGRNSVKKAHSAGAAAYYFDASLGGIVRDLPDGSRQLVKIVNGRDEVVRQIEPKR